MKKIIVLLGLLVLMAMVVNAATINIPRDYQTIQAGIDASVNGDIVLVQPGLYVENISFNGKNITVGSLFLTTNNVAYISQTIIDGGHSSVINAENSQFVISGLTIEKGIGTSIWCPQWHQYRSFGGGIRILNSKFQIQSCKIQNNQADFGGGILVDNSEVQIENCQIQNNQASFGGGIHARSGMYNPSVDDTYLTLYNCTIKENSATSNGGGIDLINTALEIDRTLVIKNVSGGEGGGMCICYSSTLIKNSTIAGNASIGSFGMYGGGIFIDSNTKNIVVNTIIWDAFPNQIEICDFGSNNELVIDYTDIENGTENIFIPHSWNCNLVVLENNIATNPLLDTFYRITENSPCIDTGTAYFEWDDEILINLTPEEYFGIAPDMGCYESNYVSADPQTPEAEIQFLNSFPNPFNNSTTISFSLARAGETEISIYNIKGQKIQTLVNKQLDVGSHQVVWNGADRNNNAVTSGVYFYKLTSENFSEMNKMILTK